MYWIQIDVPGSGNLATSAGFLGAWDFPWVRLLFFNLLDSKIKMQCDGAKWCQLNISQPRFKSEKSFNVAYKGSLSGSLFSKSSKNVVFLTFWNTHNLTEEVNISSQTWHLWELVDATSFSGKCGDRFERVF